MLLGCVHVRHKRSCLTDHYCHTQQPSRIVLGWWSVLGHAGGAEEGGQPFLSFVCNGMHACAGLHTWAVILIVFSCLGVVALVGYGAYRYRLRSAMHQEIRAIMAQ